MGHAAHTKANLLCYVRPSITIDVGVNVVGDSIAVEVARAILVERHLVEVVPYSVTVDILVERVALSVSISVGWDAGVVVWVGAAVKLELV